MWCALTQRRGSRVRLIDRDRAHQPAPSGRDPIGRWRQDVRQAWRGLVSTRATVAVAALSLALGIGVNTGVFSILDALLFRPVPYAGAERLVSLWSYYAAGKFSMKGGFNAALVNEWRAQTDLFDRVEAYEFKSFIYEGSPGAEMVSGAIVTPGLFPLLGVPPRQGRVFVEGDGRTESDRHAIVSDRFWRQHLGADPSALGRTIVLDGDRYDIVGIMPATFSFPDRSNQVWLPYDVARPPVRPGPASARFVPTVRIVPGLTRAQASERVMARGEEVNRRSGGDGQGSARVMAMGELFDERTARSLIVLGGAVLFVLLIVCANVANLTLARSMARARDRAVRVALGAARADLFRVALIEHVLIGAIGAVLGLAIAQATVVAARALLPDAMTMASLNAIDIDGRTLMFLTAVSALTVLAFGLPPAWLASRQPAGTALQQESRSSTGSLGARRVRSALVVIEVALSIVLLVGAALMTRSLLKLQAIDTGIDTEGLMTVELALPAPAYASEDARRLFREDLLSRLRGHAGIAAVTAGTLPPAENMITVGKIEFDDRIGQLTKSTMLAVYPTWPDYFRTAGIRLVEGRDFREDEVAGAVVISRDFAVKHWPGTSPLGRRFRIGKNDWRTVVGVAAEVRRMSEDDDAREQELYYPHDQVTGVMHGVRLPSAIADYWTVLVRTPKPAEIAKSIPAAVHAIDPRVIVTRTSLVAHEFADAIARPRILFVVMSVFAGVGLVLAAAGLYGVLSYFVAQRVREIGIRLALGARPRDIGRTILRSGLTLAGVGLVLGLGGAVALVRVMRSLLYDVEPFDPLSMALAIGVVVITAAAASWQPARRAMRLDPVTLLRNE
jgi:predicted permease